MFLSAFLAACPGLAATLALAAWEGPLSPSVPVLSADRIKAPGGPASETARERKAQASERVVYGPEPRPVFPALASKEKRGPAREDALVFVVSLSGPMAEPMGDGVSRLEAVRLALKRRLARFPGETAGAIAQGGRECSSIKASFGPREPLADVFSAMQAWVPAGTESPHATEALAFAGRWAARAGVFRPRLVYLAAEVPGCPIPSQGAHSASWIRVVGQAEIVALAPSIEARSGLMELARQQGGAFHEAASAEELERIVDSIAAARFGRLPLPPPPAALPVAREPAAPPAVSALAVPRLPDWPLWKPSMPAAPWEKLNSNPGPAEKQQ